MPDDVITVKYAHIKGAHFFTSNDKFGLGLCVAHQDLKTAFEETAVQLKMLLKLNHDIVADVEPTVPYEVFAKSVETTLKTDTPHMRPRISGEMDWRRVA
jgi:hypothetical protein